MIDRHIQLLQGLLERYSPTTEEQQAVDFFTGALTELGYAASVDECGNAIGVLGHGERELLLLGHIDTVPGFIPVRVEGNLLYGRGAVDAKGPLACFAAAGALAGAAAGWRVRVVGAVGEEGDSRGARYLSAHLLKPEAVIIGEPSGWQQICLGYKGTLWLTYTVSCNAAHSAGAGESACEAAVRFWNDLTEWCKAQNETYSRRFEQVSPTLRGMQSTSDGFTDSAVLSINMRLPPRFSPAEVLAYATAIGKGGLVQADEGIQAYRSDKNIPPARALLAAIRQQGGQPGFVVKSGTSDMNIVGPAWGCPIVAYGPGDSSLDHTPNEQIDLDEYSRSIQVLAGALRGMMGIL